MRGGEGLAPAGVEAAEQLVKLQPQRLDADERGLYAHDDDVADDEAEDGVAPARLGQGIDYEHHYGVADGISADSQEAQAVRQPAQEGLEEDVYKRQVMYRPRSAAVSSKRVKAQEESNSV